MKSMQINHLYMDQNSGGIIKVLARVDSPHHGDIFIAEHLMSGRILAFDADTDYSEDWCDVTDRNFTVSDTTMYS